MLQRILIAGMAALLATCASVDSVNGGEQLEGWKREGEIDVYYVKTPARASELAINRGDPAMMKTTCMESSKLQALDNIIRKMVGESLEAQSGMLDGQTTNYAITSLRNGQIKGVQQKECAPTGEGGSWQNCECVHYVSGPNLRKQIQIEVTKAVER